jgi:hypothetical protein
MWNILYLAYQIFTHVTKTMSRAGTPNLPWAIPLYEGMKKSLEGNFNDATLPPRLRQAAAAGLQKLNTYYSFAQNNHFNIIATGMTTT